MAALYSLVHREFGPISTFAAHNEADRELGRVLEDEPGWVNVLSIEVFWVDSLGGCIEDAHPLPAP